MKRALLNLMVVSAMVMSVGLPALGQQGPETTATHYLEAVKQGDVVAIKSYIGGKLLKRRQVLLEQNRNYPEFLRNRYKGMEHRVLGTAPGSSTTQRLVEIELQFPDGTRSLSTLILDQNQKGIWQVVDQNKRSP